MADRRKVHGLTLAFADNDAERTFRETFLNKDVSSVRHGIILGIVICVVSGVLRDAFGGAGRSLAATIPSGVAGLLFAGAYLLSYSTFFFQRTAQQVLGFTVLLAGLLVSIGPQFLGNVPPSEGANALILVTFGGYALLNVRFVYALAVGVLLLVAHMATELSFGGLTADTAAPTLFLLAAANGVGGLASYNLESSKRSIFQQTLQISRRRMEVKRLNTELNEIAIRDPLTKLYNRRYLDTRLGETIDVYNRYGTEATLILIDLDNFKQVNDQLGHNAGDELLEQVARALEDHFREADLVFRYGGDEFVVVMPSTELAAGTRVAERLLTALKVLEDRAFEGKTVKVGFSAGVCALREKGEAMESVLHRADTALYQAKKAGKGRVVTAAA